MSNVEESKIKIVINLDNSLLENSKNEENIIQQDAFKACKKLLKNKLELAKKYESKDFDRFHETITVQGERGTGKTSFILSVKKMIEENKIEDIRGIQTLDILDPTLLSDRQKVLLTIISNIVESVKSNNDRKEETQLNEWHDKLVKLAEALNSIINVGSDPSKDNLWDDAGLILEKGLIKSKAGVSFERQFHEFIEYSLQLVNKKAFLLILDDIDTNFEKGWDVLEIIRKYITTPHIITIISGDIKLYNYIIRQEKWKLFEDLKNYENINKYKNEVDSLQEQYLIKILKPENYINLNNLNYYLEYKKEDYEISVISEGMSPLSLNTFVENIFSSMFGIIGHKGIFLNMPIRTNIQVFKAYVESLNSKSPKKYFFQRLKDIFITTFSNFEINLQFFEFIREDENINRFLSEFITHEVLDFKELSDFKLINRDEKIKGIILILSGMYNAYFQGKQYKYFEWISKIIILKELLKKDELLITDNEIKTYFQFDKFLSSEKRILKILGYKTDLFSIRTYKDATLIERADNEKIIKDIKSAEVKTEKELLLLSCHYGLNEKTTQIEDCISFLFLFSFVEGLLKIGDSAIENNIENYLKSYLSNAIENRIVSTPLLIKSNEKSEILENDTEQNDENTDFNFSREFILNLQIWLKKVDHSNSFLDITNITNIFSKLFYNYIEKNKEYKRITSLYDYFEFHILLFLNQLLVSSFESKTDTITTFRSIKPKSKRRFFSENFTKYKDELTREGKLDLNDYTDLFIVMLNCPIWLYFIENYEEYLTEKNYLSSESNENDEEYKYKNLCYKEDFSNITIQGEKMKSELFKSLVEKIKEESSNLTAEAVTDKILRDKAKELKKKFARPLPVPDLRRNVINEVFESQGVITVEESSVNTEREETQPENIKESSINMEEEEAQPENIEEPSVSTEEAQTDIAKEAKS